MNNWSSWRQAANETHNSPSLLPACTHPAVLRIAQRASSRRQARAVQVLDHAALQTNGTTREAGCLKNATSVPEQGVVRRS